MNMIAFIIYLTLTLTSFPALSGPKKASYRELCATLQHLILPQYPPDAISTGSQGDVLIDIEVDRDGKVSAVKEQSGPSILAAAAHAAVMQWRFGKGPLARSLPQYAEIVFRYRIGRGTAGLSDENDRLVVHVPSELPDSGILDAGGSTLSFLAATKAHAPFPTGAIRQSARVEVEVETTDAGKVIAAQAGSGNPAYRAVAEDAARRWTFRKINLNGNPIRLRGRLVFNWVVN
jgi:TonB family protein